MRSRWSSAPPASRSPSTAVAQGTITPNYKDADLSQIIEAVSAVTGKNFIVDPRVKAQVTMLSSSPMTPNAFYEAFLSILQVHGFVAVPSGDVIKIIPDANARQVPANDLPSRVSSTSDEIVTQVVAVKNVSAAQLVPILRPLIPQYGHLAAYPASNMLIISDRASNVNRLMRIIQRIDQTGRRSDRRDPDAARERGRSRAHRQHPVHRRRRRRRRGHAVRSRSSRTSAPTACS